MRDRIAVEREGGAFEFGAGGIVFRNRWFRTPAAGKHIQLR
jgi:hypothetical protein